MHIPTATARACRSGCAACCIAPSISSLIPGMPHGKPAGVPCIQLTSDLRCALFGDPRRPAGYAPLDAFWRRRGYARRAEISVVFDWKEVGDDRRTPHALGFWTKAPL